MSDETEAEKMTKRWQPPPLQTNRAPDEWQPPRRRPSWLARSLIAAALLFAALVAATILSWSSLTELWANTFQRVPPEEWSRATAVRELPQRFANGSVLAFHISRIEASPAEPAVAQVTVSGTASIGEPLYEEVSVEDALGESGVQLPDLQPARAHAARLKAAGVAVDEAPDFDQYRFVRTAANPGQTFPFELAFQARRNSGRWQMDKLIAARVTPTNALQGSPRNMFQGNVRVLGSDTAKAAAAQYRQAAELYIAQVSEAERTAGRFTDMSAPMTAQPAVLQRTIRPAAENALFLEEARNPTAPVSPGAAQGERYPETRMRLLGIDEVRTWPQAKLRYAINEMFARRGAEFQDAEIATWFRRFPWYNPQPGVSFDRIKSSMSDIERGNVKVLAYARALRAGVLGPSQINAQSRGPLPPPSEPPPRRRSGPVHRHYYYQPRPAPPPSHAGHEVLEHVVKGVIQGILGGGD